MKKTNKILASLLIAFFISNTLSYQEVVEAHKRVIDVCNALIEDSLNPGEINYSFYESIDTASRFSLRASCDWDIVINNFNKSIPGTEGYESARLQLLNYLRYTQSEAQFHGRLPKKSDFVKESSINVFITRIINSTKHNISIEYSSPENIIALSPAYPYYRGPNLERILNSSGICLSESYKNFWNILLCPGAKVLLDGAYIPKIKTPMLTRTTITLKIGPNPMKIFAKLALYGEYVEIIHPDGVSNHLLDKKAADKDCYTLEIRQLKDESFKVISNPLNWYNGNAFNLILSL